MYQENSTGTTPTLNEVATAGNAANGSTAFGYGASSPVVTSDQMASNTGVVWVIRSTDGVGDDATLQAYNATPHGRWLSLINQWPIGLANKFTSPGVWGNKIYAVTQNGHVLGFGVTNAPKLRGQGLNFPTTEIGKSSITKTITVTASEPLTITNATIAHDSSVTTPSQFSLKSIEPAIPLRGLHLSKGASASLRVTFQPEGNPGAIQGTLVVNYSSGELELPLTGLAQSPQGLLYGSTTNLDFEGVTLNTTITQTMTFTNFGATTLTWSPPTLPSNGYSISNVPTIGSSLAPGDSIVIDVSYSPGDVQAQQTSSFTLSAKGVSGPQSWVVSLSAYGAQPAHLVLTTSSGGSSLGFGSVNLGNSSTRSFTFTNTGGSTATFTSVSSIATPSFVFGQLFGAGFQLQAGSSITVNVIFQPSSAGNALTTLHFTTNVLGDQTFDLNLSGTATGAGFSLPPFSTNSGWTSNGSASISKQTLTLTQPEQFQAGSAYWPQVVPSNNMTFSYTTDESLGDGADAAALVLANASTTTVTTVGSDGPGLGFDKVDGVGVVLGTFPEPGSPPTTDPLTAGNGWLGITSGWNATTNEFSWLGGVNLPAQLGGVQNNPLRVTVDIEGGVMTVYIDGLNVLALPIVLPPSVLVGFAASTGGLYNSNVISDFRATIGGPLTSATLGATKSLVLPTTNVGSVKFATTKLINNGSAPITILGASPSSNAFLVSGVNFPLEVGAAHSARLRIGFQPRTVGQRSGTIVFHLLDGATKTIAIKARATGANSLQPQVRDWRRNGNAKLVGSALELTSLQGSEAGSAWSKTLTNSPTSTMSFTPQIKPGNGADGIAVLFGSSSVPDTALGLSGWGLGFAPVAAPTYAVVFSEYKERGAPSANFVGISNDGANGALHWLATAALPENLGLINTPVAISSTSSSITVWVNGVVILEKSGLTLSPSMRLGVSGSSGDLVDLHELIGLRATSP